MPTHLAFLRAVNVGRRQYPMAELRAALEAAGWDGVATHIQTGNVRVVSSRRSWAVVERALEEVFAADRGFEVPTVVLSPAELREVVAQAEGVQGGRAPGHAHIVSLLKVEPGAAAVRAVQALGTESERVIVRGRAVHLLLDVPVHEAKVANAGLEKHLGVATARNLRVLRALVEKWC